MSKFKKGDKVQLRRADEKEVFKVVEVLRCPLEDNYRLDGLHGRLRESSLMLAEIPPLTKLQAMHNMLDGQVYTDGRNKYYALTTDRNVTFVYENPVYEIQQLNGLWSDVATWTPYTPPKEWYEEIPEGGVLCWVDDSCLTKEYPQIVVDYEPDDVYKFKTSHSGWAHATPVKPEECLQPKEV